MKIRRKLLSLFLCVIMAVSLCPQMVFAEGPDLQVLEDTGLCEHHPQHTAECGYIAAQAEIPCDMSCKDTDGDEVVDHVESCAYQPAVEGEACGYVCEICNGDQLGESEPAARSNSLAENGSAEPESETDETDPAVLEIQTLIAALPTAEELTAMSLQDQQAVYEQVQDAYDAYNALTEEQKEQITGEEIFDALFALFNGMVETAADNVSYLDEDGNTQTCTSAVNVSNTDTTWSEGWYVVEGNVEVDHTISISGNVNLILADNSLLTIDCATGNAILVSENASLTVYAQSKTDSAGVLTANSSQSKTPGIKSNGGALTIIGAKVNSSYISFTDTNFTVKSGATVTVEGRDSNLQGISYTNGTMEIIDSAVSVTHYRDNSGTGIYGNQKINTSGPKGTLIVRGNSTLNVKSDWCGLDIEVLEVYGGQVDVQVLTTAARSNGAIDAYDITVSGGSLTAKAKVESSTTSAVTASAFNMTGGVRSITVTDGKLTGIAEGPSYVECIQGGGTADLNISGGEVYLEATAENYSAYGARIKRYTITGGSCTSIANSKQSPTESSGLYANFGYNISGGTTTTMGNGWAFYQQYKPTVSESFRHVTYGNKDKSADDAEIVDETQSGFDWNNYKYIRIEPKPRNDQTAVPGAPTVKSVTSNSITLNEVTGTGQGNVQYGYTTGSDTADDIANWQDGTTFTGLSAGTDYIFYTRYAGNEEYNPSTPSTGLPVTTLPEITAATLDVGTVGVKYEESLTATAASGKTVTWALADGSNLPDGLSLSSDGTIAGTPKETVVNHSFTVQAAINGPNSTTVTNTKELSITISAGTPNITVTLYNGTTQTNLFEYGDVIKISGSIAASSQASGNGISTLSEPTQNQVALFLGDIQLTEPVTVGNNGTFNLTYDTSDKEITTGESAQTLTLRYGGSSTLTSGSTTVEITLKPKSVTAQVQNDITKVYDGDTDAKVSLAVADSDLVNSNDDITVTGTGTYQSAGVGMSIPVTVSNIQTGGDDKAWYSVDAPTGVTGSITQSGSTLLVQPVSTRLTYGDMLEIKITPTHTGQAPASNGIGLLEAGNSVELYNGDTLLAGTSTKNTDGTYTLSYDTKDKRLSIGSNELTVKFNGDTNMAASTATVTVTLSVKKVTASVFETPSKIYDGDTDVEVSLGFTDNVLVGSDSFTGTVSGNFADANVGTGKEISLGNSPEWSETKTAGYYNISLPTNVTGNISKALITGEVTISGNPVRGAVLTASYTPGSGEEVSYQWTRDGKPIYGADSSTYTPSMEDVGHEIAVTVTATDNNHTGSVTSGSVTVRNPSSTIYYALHFDTNGGNRISSIVREAGTIIDLSEYVPVREGYTFTGWYEDDELTRPVTEVTLDNTKTIHAGWEEIQTDTRQQQEIFMTVAAQERDLANGSRNTMSRVCTLKLGFAVEDPDLNLSYETSDPEVATVEDGKITYQGVGTCTVTVTAAATDLCEAASLEITVKVGSLGTPTFTPTVTSRTAPKAFVVTSSTVRGVDGWEVQYSIRDDFWRATTKDFPDTGAKLYRETCTTVHSNMTYYIHVRGYQIIDGEKVYSDWSPVKTIRTK